MRISNKIIAASLFFVLAFMGTTDAKVKSDIPSVTVKNMKGRNVNTSTFSNDGKPFIINFWATWCKPCILELNNINDKYAKWQKETGVKIIAISIDDSRNSRRVAPFVKGRGWDYEVYLDENSDFKRALNVNNPPHTFLYDGDGNLVYTHNGYAPGDEDELYEKLKEISKKK